MLLALNVFEGIHIQNGYRPGTTSPGKIQYQVSANAVMYKTGYTFLHFSSKIDINTFKIKLEFGTPQFCTAALFHHSSP